jgi:hypothetical protein
MHPLINVRAANELFKKGDMPTALRGHEEIAGANMATQFD